MNRGYNEERYRPLDDDWQNQPQTSKTSSQPNKSADKKKRSENQEDSDRFSPESDTSERGKESGAP